MAAQEFIASYWTLAGDVTPLGPPSEEASAHGLSERLAVAAELGYSGIGLMHSDLCKILRQYDYKAVNDMLVDHGMKYLELEFLVGWMADGEELKNSQAVFNDMLEAAENIGVRHLKVGPDMNAKKWPMDKMIERFASLCERAAEAGTTIALEPMPWSNIIDLKTACTVVSGANPNQGGLLLDIWHMARGGINYQEIADIPHHTIRYVEINDADQQLHGSLLEDTLNHRKFCGDGELNVVEFLDALTVAGYNGPYGIEILSAEQRQRPYYDVARDAINTAKREFSKLNR